MEAVLKKLKKHWTLIWLLFAVSAATAFLSYGAYTGLKTVKRVVTTQASAGELFSSNCMMVNVNYKQINTTQYTVSVCNYEQKNPNLYNASDISYSLTAEIKVFYDGTYKTMSELAEALNGTETPEYQAFVTKIGNRTYSVVKVDDDEDGALSNVPIALNADNGYRYSFSTETLKKNRSSADRFQVTFDNREFDNKTPDFYIDVKATPGANLAPIECLIYTVKSTADMATWTGAFLENDCTTNDYDFYNYIVSGSGAGTIDVMWDPEWFDINPYFISLSGGAATAITTINDANDTHDGWKKVTITVNSTQNSRYEIQMYKVKNNTSYTGENAATKYIDYRFVSNDQ